MLDVAMTPQRAAGLLLLAARNAGTLCGLGGPGSGNFGHAGRPGEAGGSSSDGGTAETVRQTALAAAQQALLAHPVAVVGGSNDPAVARYVAAYGSEHTAAPLPSDVSRGKDRECYKNASLLVFGREDLNYAEGFAQNDATGDIVFQHAWAVDRAGHVVDPTWKNPEKGKYFGVTYERKAYIKYLVNAKVYGVLGSTRANAAKAVATGGMKLRALGGPGSGNFGHAGRPGEVGGSSSEGSGASARREKTLHAPSSAYPPANEVGPDTKMQFQLTHGGAYTPERERLHKAIIAKDIEGTTPVERPVAIVLGGGPASGKSELVNEQQLGKDNTVIANADHVRQDLPEYREQVGKNPSIAALTHEEASDVTMKLIERAGKSGRNVLLDGTGDGSIERLTEKVDLMRAGGQEVVGKYVTLPVEDALLYATSRANDPASPDFGRRVPESFIRESHKNVSKVFPEAVRRGIFDRFELHDTSSRGKMVLVASGKRTELVVHDAARWDAFLAKGQAQ